MNNRFQFRAIIPVSYYDENGEDKETMLYIENVAVYSDGAVGCSENDLYTAIVNLNLSESESDSIREFVENNYSTESDLWYFFDNANIIIEQCTGLKDKNGNLIYENDVVKFGAFGLSRGVVKFGEYENCMPCGDENVYCSCVGWYLDDGYGTYPLNNDQLEIIGNIHTTKDNK